VQNRVEQEQVDTSKWMITLQVQVEKKKV